MTTNELKEQLLDEWMKENPPFDNDKEKFEDYLVRQIKHLKENFYSEHEILNVLNKYYTESAPNQHIKQNIIGDLKYDHR